MFINYLADQNKRTYRRKVYRVVFGLEYSTLYDIYTAVCSANKT